MTTIVTNAYGTEINYEAAVELMDDELREALAAEDIDTEQEFFAAYCAAHETKFGEVFELTKQNPVW